MSAATPDPLPAFVSRQVTEARRFFLNLDPDRSVPLAVVCGGVERMRPEYVVRRQDFPYYAIELVAEGEGSLSIEGNHFPLAGGAIFAYGPGVAHTIRNDAVNGMRKYYLDFVGRDSATLLAQAGLVNEAEEWNAIPVGGFHQLIEIFEMLNRNALDEGPLVDAICESLARLLLMKIQQLRIPKGRNLTQSYATYSRICRYIENHFCQLTTIQQVADACEVTPVYLSRLFNRFADCGAHQFLMRQKMNYAAGLLMNEGLLVKEVAERMGFADPFQFSRSFKRVYGVAPKRLLQMERFS